MRLRVQYSLGARLVLASLPNPLSYSHDGFRRASSAHFHTHSHVELQPVHCTTKDLVPWPPFAKEKLCPKPGAFHSFPFQPSPYESVIFRVHVAPSATANGMLEVYGAPPLSVVSSEQLRLQPTSPGYPPPEQVIAEEIVGAAGGEGGEGGAGGPAGGKEIKLTEVELTEVELTEVELTEVELTEVEFTELNFLGTCCGVLNHMLRLCMLRFCMLQRRWLMSVMAETHQVIAEEMVGGCSESGGGRFGGEGGEGGDGGDRQAQMGFALRWGAPNAWVLK